MTDASQLSDCSDPPGLGGYDVTDLERILNSKKEKIIQYVYVNNNKM